MTTPSSSAIALLSPARLADRLGEPGLVVLDGSYYLPAQGRDAEAEFVAGHVPGARRFDIDAVKDTASALPHMLPSPAAFAEAAGRLGIDETTTVVAYDGMGLFSAARVAWTFRTFGSARVAVLDGGFPAWRAAGLPVETGPAAPAAPRSYRPAFDAAVVADRDTIAAALRSGAAQVADARSPARFTGEEAEPRAGMRSGHMPGAVNVHYGRLVAEGRLKSEAELRRVFEEAGLDLDRPILTSCGSGVTAAILTLALERIGCPAQALYDGSWAEWGSRADTDVATGP